MSSSSSRMRDCVSSGSWSEAGTTADEVAFEAGLGELPLPFFEVEVGFVTSDLFLFFPFASSEGAIDCGGAGRTGFVDFWPARVLFVQ